MGPTPTFNAPDGDIILLSSDPEPVEFRIHKCILAASSPFFKDMFSLPQPPTFEQQLPVISVTEPSDALDAVMKFIYPVPDPEVSSLEELVNILGAAMKYDFIAVITALRKILVSPRFVETQALRVFAIACRYDLEEEAKIASRYTLRENILDCPLSDDLRYITAYSYHRLLELHRNRARAAQQLLKIPDDIKCPQCNVAGHSSFGSPKWWTQFEARAREELAVRPTTDVIFDMEFLAKASEAGCIRCPANLFQNASFLHDLKRKIDELPSTI